MSRYHTPRALLLAMTSCNFDNSTTPCQSDYQQCFVNCGGQVVIEKRQ